MQRIALLLLFACTATLCMQMTAADTDSLYIRGRVKQALGKFDLTEANAYLLDANGNRADSSQCNRGATYINGEWVTQSFFGFLIPRADSTYTIEVVCDRYTPQIVTYTVDKIGRREGGRTVPTIYLEKAPHVLKELGVTATKIKFYNRGDTVVYNADAFELAEGSMLDALISQLPGVELKEGGQILVNGEQVESLLLNGRDFFDNNNELMLENIGAYTVKNIEVYKGYTPDEKWKRQDHGEKHLTMDVKLKREYNTGLTANAQVGYGTDDRYSARLFGLWFNSSTRITAVANFNNLNDTRKPGQKDSWKPEMMPSGTRKYQLGALDYNYQDADETKRFRGDITYTSTINDNRTTNARTNFFASGNTYENSYSSSHNRSTRLSTYHYGSWRGQKWMPGYVVKAIYQDKDNESESLSGAFSAEQQNMTMEVLKALYSTADPATLNSVLNRASTRTDGRSRNAEIQFFPYLYYFIPKSHDQISNEFGVRYRRHKDYVWKDYTVNYRADPVPAEQRRQYIDNTPHSYLGIQDNLSYNLQSGKFYMSFNYEFWFASEVKDSYQYALDRLADAGVFGTLPAGWLNTLDPQNSFTSRALESRHSISPRVNYYDFNDKYQLILSVSPDVALTHQHLDYTRANRLYQVRKNFALLNLEGWGLHADYAWGLWNEENARNNLKHNLTLDFLMKANTPKLTDMVTITDDSNPLNIYMGNPDLKVEYNFRPQLTYRFSGPSKHPLYDNISIQYNWVRNALTRGYTYDTSTGVRTNRMYNVDGNRSMSMYNNFSLQFGRSNQFTFESNTSFSLSRYTDMIGVNLDTPALSVVDNRNVSESMSFQWQFARQSLMVKGEYMNRHSYSDREDFNTINADHFSYGVIGNFKLPYNIGISTDLTVYGRRGYGVRQLDTNDVIWNARLTWTPPRAKEWTLMVDGFDMLHQLSNVNYAVTASGRTVSYSNALPRYVLFSVQYRFQRKPRK